MIDSQVKDGTLTATTCDPASTSASISARLLYCCGDSITISLLGALPARPCMVVNPACMSTGVNSLHTHCHGTELPAVCEGGESSVYVQSDSLCTQSQWPCLPLPLSPLPLIRREGPLPPSQLCSCKSVCGQECVFIYSMCEEAGRRNGPLPHSKLRRGPEIMLSCVHLHECVRWCVSEKRQR